LFLEHDDREWRNVVNNFTFASNCALKIKFVILVSTTVTVRLFLCLIQHHNMKEYW